jgi:hypothetical protein
MPDVHITLANGEQAIVDREVFRRILTSSRGILSQLQMRDKSGVPKLDKKCLTTITFLQSKDDSLI